MEDTFGAFAVGFLVWGEDEEVIHVDDKPPFHNHISEGVVHESLECSQRVGKSKEHDCWFKKPLVGDEGGFPLMAIFDVNIVIAPSDVELGE